jgi:hypothetical protein
MREVAKEMGLSDSTVFTPAVQDAMFHHIARKALSGKTSAAQKRAAMRGKWEGFKSVSDPQLDRAIAEFEGSESPSYEVETRASRADVQAELMSVASVLVSSKIAKIRRIHRLP